MAGSSIGKNIVLTTWGESHGEALGVVIDGFPAGMDLSEADIQTFLDRRKPGTSAATTSRKEDDLVQILSGVFEGKTTGTPISLMVKNTSQRSSDYNDIANIYRPGHADYGFDQKYGFRDYRGGGRSSGRETIGRVAAGAIASTILKNLNISITSYVSSIGDIDLDYSGFDEAEIYKNPLYMPDSKAAEKAAAYLDKLRAEGNSSGGIVDCIIKGMPAGIGEPVFDKVDSSLAGALMSIGGVKAVEIGDGIKASRSTGLENNDFFRINDGNIVKKTNHSGGTLGGITDGSDIILRAHFKPTPSVSAAQETVNNKGEEISVNIKGRHDPIIVPRAVVVVESMAAVAVTDLLIRNLSSRIDNLKKIYL